MEIASLILLLIFAFVSFVHLVGELLVDFGKDKFVLVRFITKPLLMPLLLAFFVSSLLNFSVYEVWFVIALVFGFLGDVFLMIPDPEKKRLGLKLGLSAFLLGHISYIVAFIINARGFILWQWWGMFLALPFIGAVSIAHPYITKNTGKMTKAVTAYIFIICLMCISSTFLFLPEGWPNYQLGAIILYLGAWLFVVSDLFNGIGRFVKKFRYERILTMFSYISSQLLIVLGFIIWLNGSL